MLDYAGPAQFTPAPRSRGVGEHPHRGFETVTIVYQGEVEHRDSTGSGGRIGPGDVQWMTAGSGILHEEFHSKDFTEKGGTLEMIQLWVNLRAKDKTTAPGYQTVLNRDIPCVTASGRCRPGSCHRRGIPGQAWPGPHIHTNGCVGLATESRRHHRTRANRGAKYLTRLSCAAPCWSTVSTWPAKRNWSCWAVKVRGCLSRHKRMPLSCY